MRREKTPDMVDQMLKYAAELRMEEMAGAITAQEAGAHTVSSDFDSHMNTYFKQVKRRGLYRRTRKALMRAAVVLLAVIAVSTTLVLSVDAFRVPALEFLFKTNDNSLSVSVHDDTGIYDSYNGDLSGLYLPDYVPKGYVFGSIERLGNIYTVQYKNETGGYVSLHHFVEGGVAKIDNEDAVIEDVTVNGEATKIYVKNGISNLLFKYQKNVFLLCGHIGKEEAIRMAESLQYYR